MTHDAQCSIYDKFVEKATRRAQKTKVGNPFDADTDQGPQVWLVAFWPASDLPKSELKRGSERPHTANPEL